LRLRDGLLGIGLDLGASLLQAFLMPLICACQTEIWGSIGFAKSCFSAMANTSSD
jgi:hypothetical protein